MNVLPDFASTSTRGAREDSVGIVETRNFEKLDEEEKVILQGVFELRIREIIPRIGPDVVSYEGLEEIRRAHFTRIPSKADERPRDN